ncbi:tyrosine/phenylalanine carboxypeptidase domain-containing protein [Parvularcula dongshanensis]|uniref:Uncharacterized protein (TIGR02421 family) n=1 Tax=Parvularcula dongshanensis TaxID=1173995 RepID=A0A840I6C1_9PROT|nr:tyrosine/phenylalanine carboxypeptidase domain-containing protein [Parvularcula dongshanensis]MBB4659982.1 uncharacterized protein (TIGR02421 family) [Parvularcula dongshanensis]
MTEPLDLPTAPPRSLPPVAARVDAALLEIDREVDWLVALSPLGNDAMWHDFVESGFAEEPVLRYPAQREDLHELRERLLSLPVEEIEEGPLEAILQEKQRELDRQIELVSLRCTEGFVAASIDLFGDADPDLLRTAQNILDSVEREDAGEEGADAGDFVRAAEAEFAAFAKADPRFRAEIHVLDDLNSSVMVNHGDLYVARSMRVGSERVAPLIAHEVGTHVLTAHNGRQQTLLQLSEGLAGYDPLQEGLGTFAEYLTGYLPPKRLRILAARVIAADLAVQGLSVCQIFERLYEGEGMLADDAFDTAVRAKRGGGLTKDAVYLRGLRELLAYLATGGDFEFLLLGKFAMSQRHIIRRLLDEGWLTGPALLPSYLNDEQARRRLDRARRLTVDQLFQRTPAPERTLQ